MLIRLVGKLRLQKEQEVCEQVEVQPKSLKEAWDICWKDGISNEEFVMCSLMEENKLDFGSKEKTIEWLDENCEHGWILGENNEVYGEKFICGDYTVEVKK